MLFAKRPASAAKLVALDRKILLATVRLNAAPAGCRGPLAEELAALQRRRAQLKVSGE